MKERDNAGVIAPPPLIYVAALLLSLFLQNRVPLPLVPSRAKNWLGTPLIAGSLAIGFSAFSRMRGAGTNLNPTQPTTTLITTGPFRFSRNPIYLSFVLLYAGLAVLFNTLWAILLLPVVLQLMNWGVIEREEAYLERKFGAQYRTYTQRVRRWL